MVASGRPVIGSENATVALAEPRAVPPVAGRRVPKVSLQVPGLVVLTRNQPVVVSPRAMPEALSTAELVVMLVAESVVTDGAVAGVVKNRTLPKVVPKALLATAQ